VSLADKLGPPDAREVSSTFRALSFRPECLSAPRGPGMAWALRTDLGPNPDDNEEPGARLGRFRPSGCKKCVLGTSSGTRLGCSKGMEMWKIFVLI
jgi:hypothetical protein